MKINYRTQAVINAVVLAIHILVSYLSQAGITGKYTVGEVSDKFPTYFTPAGIAFSVWGLIYLSLTAMVTYHLVMAFRKEESHPANRDLQKIGSAFIINNIATIGWLVAWTSGWLLLSVFLILIQFVTLFMIHERLRLHDPVREYASKIFTQFPVSIYFGWIFIAIIANISAYLKSIAWNGWGMSEVNWGITMTAVAIMLTVWVINRKRNVVFGLVAIWGLYGLILKGKEEGTTAWEPLILVAWTGIIIIAFACLFGLIRNLRIRIRHARRGDIRTEAKL